MANNTTWTEDESLAEYFDELHSSAMAAYRENPNLIEEHANQEDQIRVGGYGDRIIRELVQNGADALVGASADESNAGRIEVVLDEWSGTLYVANAGRPFSPDGLRSITHAHLSGKRGDEIGRFGLGFKSVLAVTSQPQVFSRMFSFEFGAESMASSFAKLRPGVKKSPIFRAATRLSFHDAAQADVMLEELGEWAATVIRLPDVGDTARLRAELMNFPTQFLLFVDSVREIRLRIIGDGPIDRIHKSRSLGANRFVIESPDGESEEWVVGSKMHAPSHEARQVVGDAVVRDRIKVSVAMPVHPKRQFLGSFWSYFPLADETSASALFNAPWSLNDDRTSMLDNEYNREIQETLIEIFMGLLPSVSSPDDPGRHLDYLPSRAGKEYYSTADRYIRSEVPRRAAQRAILPDARGGLQHPSDLRPLDLEQRAVTSEVHRYWQQAPNTGDDVPHWTCYSTPTRALRLEELLAARNTDMAAEVRESDMHRAKRKVVTRGLLSWVREWAEGAAPEDAVIAVKFVLQQFRKEPRLEKAPVVPTDHGLVSLQDRNTTFLDADGELWQDGRPFVDPDFLAVEGIRDDLERVGFRKLDAQTKVEAVLSELTPNSGDERHQDIWDATVDELTMSQASETLSKHGQLLKVPTLDAGWAWPAQVIALDGVDSVEAASGLLDESRAPVRLAKLLGVVDAPTDQFPLSDELYGAQYQSEVKAQINGSLGPGERPIERIAFLRESGPGPVSALLLLEKAGASFQEIGKWTKELLQVSSEDAWMAEDPDSGRTFEVESPRQWAIRLSGAIRTDWGWRRPGEVVDRSLLEYRGLLPLSQESPALVQDLGLPRDLSEVPDGILEEGLRRDDYSLVDGRRREEMLHRFLEHAASRLGAERLIRVPACVGDRVESVSTSNVYTVSSDDQAEYLRGLGKPYLRVPQESVESFTVAIGAQAFDEVFALGTEVSGGQEPEEIMDVFTGFRNDLDGYKLRGVQFVKAEQIDQVARTAGGGVERKPLSSHLENRTLYVPSHLSDLDILLVINDVFDLDRSLRDLEDILEAGQEAQIEDLKREARGRSNDAQRLETYFTDAELRSVLPNGLWTALESQGLVDDSTSLGELYLGLEGDQAIDKLRSLFREKGFKDVPEQWKRSRVTRRWLNSLGFGPEYATARSGKLSEFEVVPGAVNLPSMHDYQRDVSGQLRDVLVRPDERGRSQKAMVEMPTGAGKTRVASETILERFSRGELEGPVLWIAESKELCEQAVQTWRFVWRGLLDERPLTIGRLWENYDLDEPDTDFSVIMATDAKLRSILKSDSRRERYSWLLDPSAVIVDEAHRAGGSEMYTSIFQHLGVDGRNFDRPLIGLSATPFKGGDDGTEALARRFGGRLIQAFQSENPYREAVEKQVLAEVEHRTLDGVRVEMSDKERRDARTFRRVNNEVLQRIGGDQDRLNAVIEDILRLDEGWPVLVFTPSVVSAQILAAVLRFRGVTAESVSGSTDRDERRRVIDRFKAGKIRVLANCDLLTQGFDAPGVRALYVARPTFSPGAYIQMVGRGLRGPKNGGKEKCLIVDVDDSFGAEDDLLGHRAYTELWKENAS